MSHVPKLSQGNTPLIVGADSKIGRALMAAWQVKGRQPIGTSRRADAARENVRIDLTSTEPPAIGPDVSIAVIAAGRTSLADCRQFPAETRPVNVDGVVRLGQWLRRRGIFVVFLSTNHVFDGSRPHRPANDNRCPANEYGRQKAEAEERLLELGEGVAIVRLTKVLFPGDSRLAGWTEALRRGEAVRAAANLSLAPVPAELAIEGIIRVAESRASGIIQFSAPDETSYFQAAKAIAVTVDAREDLVCDEPATVEPGPHGEIPRHASLDASRAARELRLTFPLSVDVVLQAAGVGHGVSLT